MEFFSYKTEFSSEGDYENDILDQPSSDQYFKMVNLEKEVTAMRIEYIKYQILKKLRLKEKPLISQVDLQKTKEYANLLPNQEDHFQSPYDDDFYGKTTQAVIFPYEGEYFFAKKIHLHVKL